MTAPRRPRQGLVSFMATLAGPQPAEGWLELRHRHRGGMRQRFFRASEPQAAATAATVLAQIGDVYVGCAVRSQRAGSKNAVAHSWVLWVDCDDHKAGAALDAFRPKPTIVVRTSRRGRHAYWALDRPLAVEELERANRRLSFALGADAACADAARILRPPATVNHKYEPAFPVMLERYTPDRLHAQSVVGTLCDPPSMLPSRPAAEPSPARAGDPLLAIEPAVYVRVLTGRQVGRDGKARCPFHPDRTPSLHAYRDPARGWACYSARCAHSGRPNGGDIYDLAGQLWLTGQSSDMPLRGKRFIEVRERLMALFFGDGNAA
jgi:RepB DNA-primase from phage plasmid